MLSVNEKMEILSSLDKDICIKFESGFFYIDSKMSLVLKNKRNPVLGDYYYDDANECINHYFSDFVENLGENCVCFQGEIYKITKNPYNWQKQDYSLRVGLPRSTHKKGKISR